MNEQFSFITVSLIVEDTCNASNQGINNMSHASIIVALEPDNRDFDLNRINEQISFQMLPFDENGEWFRDGTRWDWYVIGGRYTGKLLGRDLLRRRDLTAEAIEKFKIEQAKALWSRYEKDERKNDKFIREYAYGLKEDDTLETTIEKYKKSKISAFAFLQNRRWQENGRLGWWGSQTATECEIKNGHVGVCLHKDEAMNAQIISFNYESEKWSEVYFDRFIKDLHPDTILVNVDYHV